MRANFMCTESREILGLLQSHRALVQVQQSGVKRLPVAMFVQRASADLV